MGVVEIMIVYGIITVIFAFSKDYSTKTPTLIPERSCSAIIANPSKLSSTLGPD
jgi:hypothetical protein